MKTLAIAILLCMSSANAGGYIDLSVGWLYNIPIKGSTTIGPPYNVVVEEEVEISLDSPFTGIGVGYEYNGWHIEYNVFGVINDSTKSIKRVRVYKRIRF